METNFKDYNSPMSTASFALGVASVVCLIILMLPFALCLGALAIIFGLLSKTKDYYFHHAKIGLISGTVSVVINLIATIIIVYLVFFNTGFREKYIEPLINSVTEIYNDEFHAKNEYGDSDDIYYDDGDDFYYEEDSDYYPEEDFNYNNMYPSDGNDGSYYHYYFKDGCPPSNRGHGRDCF
ncbi:hypothetical protein QYZ88_002170 [Lachnospiraceae bacterium C1.1]|nr:hypothetical protein [Lachnospiraceae bacterium C1.1]